MGFDSTAHLPVFGKVDTGNEICLNAIATAYDSLNGQMLTRMPGSFNKTTLDLVNKRFSILRMLCRKHSPGKLSIIEEIYSIAADHARGKINYDNALFYLNNVIVKHKLDPGILNIASYNIDHAEQVDMNFFDFFRKQNINSKFRRRNR